MTDTNRATACSWKHNEQFTPWLAGFVNLNKVSDDTTSPTSPTASPSRRRRRCRATSGLDVRAGPVVVAGARAGLPDAAGPEPPPVIAAVQPPAADPRHAARDRLARAHVERHRPSTRTSARRALTPTGDRLVFYPTVALEPQRRRVVLHGARRACTAAQYDLDKHDRRDAGPASRA